MTKKRAKVRMRLLPRDRKGRFTKRAKKVRRKPVPALSVRRGVPVKQGRKFEQRFYIDKFVQYKNFKPVSSEYEVWTIASKGTPPLKSKRQVLKKVESIM